MAWPGMSAATKSLWTWIFHGLDFLTCRCPREESAGGISKPLVPSAKPSALHQRGPVFAVSIQKPHDGSSRREKASSRGMPLPTQYPHCPQGSFFSPNTDYTELRALKKFVSGLKDFVIGKSGWELSVETAWRKRRVSSSDLSHRFLCAQTHGTSPGVLCHICTFQVNPTEVIHAHLPETGTRCPRWNLN